MSDAFILIRAIRGAPLTVLLTAYHINRPTYITEISRLSGLTRKTVLAAVNVLLDLELLEEKPPSSTPYRVNRSACAALFAQRVNSTHSLINDNDNRQRSTYKRKTSKSNIKSEEILPTDEQAQVIDFLTANGILNPKATEIALLPWASLDYVQTLVMDGLKHSKSHGLIIHEILNKKPIQSNAFSYSSEYDDFIQR